MTDRKIVYPAAIPLETDILKTNKNAMLGVAELARTVLGVTTLLDGFACTANSPAALNVIVGAGRIYALANVDATDFGSLLADTTHNTVKQGQFWDAVTLSTPAPATVGFSVVYLVQIALQEVDSTPVVLPYYNAANPSVAYSGPGNTGVAQNTERLCRAIVSIKTGVAATTGTQATPAPDAGYTGAWAITVANGQTTVTSPNIVALSTAPFITETLIDKLSTLRMQNETPRHATAGGTSDAITATYSPAYAAYVDGMTCFVKLTAANTTTAPTFSPNGLTAKTIVKDGGTALKVANMAAAMIAELKYSLSLDKWLLQNPDESARQVPTGTILPYASAISAPTGFIFTNGAALSRTTYADLFKLLVTDQGYTTQTFTVTIANPAVFTKTAHGFINGERLRLSTTGALPTGLNTTTDYFVEKLTNDTFYLTTSVFGVATRVITTGTQSGTHSFLQSLHGLGDGSTTFNAPDTRGLFIRGLDGGRGIDTGRSVGTVQKGTLQVCDTNTGAGADGVWSLSTPLSTTLAMAQSSLSADGYTTADYPFINIGGVTPTTTLSLPGTVGAQCATGIARPSNIALPHIIKY